MTRQLPRPVAFLLLTALHLHPPWLQTSRRSLISFTAITARSDASPASCRRSDAGEHYHLGQHRASICSSAIASKPGLSSIIFALPHAPRFDAHIVLLCHSSATARSTSSPSAVKPSCSATSRLPPSLSDFKLAVSSIRRQCLFFDHG